MSRVEHVDRVERVSYNPDVLSCLANLSNDEVFTPPAVVNQMLDLLPQELFASPKTKFLDPATKSGVFLREITKRLIKGLENEIPDLHERVDHILQTQVFGIATTELTSLVARRSLYCSKYPNCKYSVSKFDTVEGNIRFRALKHTFVNGRCKWCGASASQFDRDASLESHAYEFIHTSNPEEIFNMKFDVIISNPPYQIDAAGAKAQATPLYNRFVEQAINMQPRYVVMIIPSRWFSGGLGLDAFRDMMISDKHILELHDFVDSTDCFGNGVSIKGGVCYFLRDRDAERKCRVVTYCKGEKSESLRFLKEAGSDVFIRRNEAVAIYHKVATCCKETFDKIVSGTKPFGLSTTYHGSARPFVDSVMMYERNGVSYVKNSDIMRSRDYVNRHKIFITRAYGAGEDFPHQIINKPIYGEPNSCCNETYIVIGPFNSNVEAQNAMTYMRTKFFRFMVMLKKAAQDALKKVYGFVPLQDFSKPWIDEELYKKYKLSKDEIAFIESMIKPME